MLFHQRQTALPGPYALRIRGNHAHRTHVHLPQECGERIPRYRRARLKAAHVDHDAIVRKKSGRCVEPALKRLTYSLHVRRFNDQHQRVKDAMAQFKTGYFALQHEWTEWEIGCKIGYSKSDRRFAQPRWRGAPTKTVQRDGKGAEASPLQMRANQRMLQSMRQSLENASLQSYKTQFLEHPECKVHVFHKNFHRNQVLEALNRKLKSNQSDAVNFA